MAQIVILLISLVVIGLIVLWASPRGVDGSASLFQETDAAAMSRMTEHLRALALRSPWQGEARLRMRARPIPLIKRLAAEQAELSALTVLQEDSRALIMPLMALASEMRCPPRLPKATSGEIRMALLCREWFRMGGRTDATGLLSALSAFEEGGAVTLRERESLPLCMRVVLAQELTTLLIQLHHDVREMKRGQTLAKRLERSRHPVAALTRHPLPLTLTFSLLTQFNRDHQTALLAAMDDLLAESGSTAAKITERHTRRQSLLAGEISRVLACFRALDKLDWPAVEEASNPLHRLLSDDPSGAYPRMDRDSRQLYRRRAAELAARFSVDEMRLTRSLLTLCHEADPDGLHDHVGWYLIEKDGAAALHRQLRARRGTVRLWLERRLAAAYRLSLTALAVLATLLFLSAGYPLWLWPFFMLTTGCATRFALQWLIHRAVPSTPLPRMHVERVTEDARTLIVIPTVLKDRSQAVPMVRKLLLDRKAFPEGAIDCLLLADYGDSMTVSSGEDRAVTDAARAAIEAVDGDGGRFLYLHRRRSWDADQHAYIGRERKRGALETLNRLIVHGECDDLFDEATVPPSFFHRRYAFVLTLDSDTTPAPDAILPLIGALSHPLNTRLHTAEGVRGVSILQPRMEVDPDTVRTRVSLIEGGPGGVDPYGAGAGGLWQRLTGRGNYEGKGLYCPGALLEDTQGWILPDTVLSHDLLEGELAGCAQMADVALYDGHPATMAGWLKRLHRWTRGDWQLLPWLMPYVKTPEGVTRNPLSSLSRFKIRENLRRSLVPLCQLLLLLYATLARDGWMALWAVLAPDLGCLLPCSVIGLKRLGARIIQLPLRMVIRTDAVLRALWRSLIRHEKRLDWVTSSQADTGAGLSVWENWSQWSAVAVFAGLSFIAMPPSLIGLVLGGLFALYPFVHTYLDAPNHLPARPTAAMETSLLDVAEATWRFFQETVTAEEHFLPPDNLQVKPWRGVARRTSPTNIGMYLLSCLAARELGLIDTDEMTRRVSQTMDTLEALPLWHGLPYNWYATDALQVMEPPYVSSVDCGNLCACLIALAQGLRTYLPETAEDYLPLAARVDGFAHRMQLSRLYDPSAQLFFIGINTRQAAPDNAHYDLFASEAQLLSFVAVMRREVPLRHFAMLNRTRVRVGRAAPYVSWSGTAFEYLMPRLLLPVSPGTVMDHTLHAVIRAQRRHAVDGMFGVSESGWWGFDAQLNYQYRAWGLPEVALGASSFHAVLSPYAAALCLPFDLQGAHDSLMRMRSHGMLGRLGFFESIDFDPAHLPDNSESALVESHMAHHQGMLLCAVCNALTGNVLARHFTSVPMAAACSLLLKEKQLPHLTLPPKCIHPEAAVHREAPFRRIAAPLSAPIDAHLIGSPEAMLLTSAQGLGLMRSRGIDLTRFTGDPTQIEGIQFYLNHGGETYRLTDPALPGETIFTEGCIRFTRACGTMRSTLTAMTDPVQGSILHVVDVTNLSTQDATIELADCLVPELSPAPSDHPAYSDLFIETARPEERVITVTRRPKEADAPKLTLCHALSTHEPLLALAAETDRMAFQGRNTTLHHPLSLRQPLREGLVGAPITPCASFRARLKVPGRGRAAVIFITRLMRPHEDFTLDALTPRLTDIGGIITLSRLLSRTITDALPITQEQAAALSRLTGLIMWHGQPHQGAVGPLTQPISALHALGLNPALPLITLVIHTEESAALLRDAADYAGWMHLSGQAVTLCVLCEGDQARKARDAAEETLAATLIRHRAHGDAVTLLAADLPEGVRETLEAMSRVILYEGAGTVTAQIEAMTHSLSAAPLADVDPKAPAPATESLRFDNGIGGFQEQTDDYVIHLEPGQSTPAPWCGLLTGERLGTLCMESGLNMTFAGNSHLHRLTPWSCDPVCPTIGEAAYLSDADTGALFTPTPLPLGQGLTCRVQYAPGVTSWQSGGYGLDMTLNAAVIPGSSFGVRTLRLKNMTTREKNLTLAIAARFVLGSGGPDEALTCLTPITGGVIAVSPTIAQMGCLSLVEGECISRRMSPLSFYGLHGGVPSGLHTTPPDESGSMAVLTLPVVIPAGGSAAITWILGAARQVDDMERIIAQLRRSGSSAVYRTVRQRWGQRLQAVALSTPDDSLNLLMNRVLPHQVRVSRLEGRCGFYQAGGAFGFRDQLQDMTALTLTEPARVRAHLLLCARHQYIEGDVQHWWHPPYTGVRTRIADDRLFLPFLTAWYVQRTGDRTVLQEQTPWLIGEAVPQGKDDLYHTPQITAEQDTLYVHCLRALSSMRLGERGLPLMEGGDWNDGMNRVRGESVWLAMFYAYTLKAFAELSEGDTRDEMFTLRQQLMEAIERDAWDGSWYRRAWFEDSAPLGSAQSLECRIDSLCQSWAVLALGVTERSAQAVEAAWQQLYDPRHGLMKLLTPPFNGQYDAGYIGGYLPGVRENGGQYTHAAAWMLWALCELGWRDRAWELLHALNPIHHTGTPEHAARYRLEPYALAGDVYANPQQMGRGGWSFYTGSAAWLYTVVLEKLLGLEKRGDRVRLRPLAPADWDFFTITLQYGSSTWHFHAGRDVAYLTKDGDKVSGDWITLEDDGKIHEIRTPMR